MLDGTGNNSINTQISGRSGAGSVKTSVNKYYNIFSKKMEEMILPDIDLEFNSAAAVPETTSFRRAT